VEVAAAVVQALQDQMEHHLQVALVVMELFQILQEFRQHTLAAVAAEFGYLEVLVLLAVLVELVEVEQELLLEILDQMQMVVMVQLVLVAVAVALVVMLMLMDVAEMAAVA
jgi:hypothetical protein